MVEGDDLGGIVSSTNLTKEISNETDASSNWTKTARVVLLHAGGHKHLGVDRRLRKQGIDWGTFHLPTRKMTAVLPV
jgi:hypothetical protein